MLEQEINKIIRGDATANLNLYVPIEDWAWPSGNRKGPYKGHSGFYESIHKLIEETSIAICLTSESEYIRKYREWYESRREGERIDTKETL